MRSQVCFNKKKRDAEASLLLEWRKTAKKKICKELLIIAVKGLLGLVRKRVCLCARPYGTSPGPLRCNIYKTYFLG